jgi:hypothetical protein
MQDAGYADNEPQEILDELRASVLDERDQGDKFERLIQGYLRINVLHAR